MQVDGAVMTMARKKTVKGRPPVPDPVRSILSVKGSDAFAAWLDRLVDHVRLGTRSLLIRNALREYAENHGFPEPPPRR